jgi:nitroimidazol reductase NimA-like FMN-containing flavoprotein (pyridoxamine 5'-phosphate oxidase superfamily)
MGVNWDDEVDEVLAGDLTVGLGYRTPAGGVVVQAVAPIGLRDRAAGTVGFTTSLGFSKKLERIERDPRVAMAFHAREHGTSSNSSYVLIQGRARVVAEPSEQERTLVRTQAAKYLGSARQGRFWDRWLREYYRVRVPVDVEVDRMVTWPDLRCAGEPHITGEPLPTVPAQAQQPPKKGTGPRLDPARVGRRLRRTRHILLGFAGADDRPVVVPVEVGEAGPDGLPLTTALPLPVAGRRAGLVGHSYRAQLIGLETRQYTGWLEVGEDGHAVYAPHTETGYRAPANKTLLLLLNGLLAKRGVRAAAKAQRRA